MSLQFSFKFANFSAQFSHFFHFLRPFNFSMVSANFPISNWNLSLIVLVFHSLLITHVTAIVSIQFRCRKYFFQPLFFSNFWLNWHPQYIDWRFLKYQLLKLITRNIIKSNCVKILPLFTLISRKRKNFRYYTQLKK